MCIPPARHSLWSSDSVDMMAVIRWANFCNLERFFNNFYLRTPLKRKNRCLIYFSRSIGRASSLNPNSNATNHEAAGKTSSDSTGRAVRISKAMRAYLQRAKEHDEFMVKETTEYQIGKRHLANMMGVDPDNFTQEDVDKAIEYLLPSGLFEPKARPRMKTPEETFPKRKAAEFDESGRPFHCLFYTTKPNFYQALHDVAVKINALNSYEDGLISKGIRNPDPQQAAQLKGTSWLEKDEMEKLFLEILRDEDFTYLITCLDRLTSHPYSGRETGFILKFRKELLAASLVMEVPELKFDDTGRPFAEADGNKKRSTAHVIVRGRGTGKIEINGTDISYFDSDQSRRQILFPLQFTDLIDTVDIEANVHGRGGFTAEANAIRHAVSLALRSFVSTEMVERMRLAGLLSRDPRHRERKKPGQEGARRKYTWKKR